MLHAESMLVCACVQCACACIFQCDLNAPACIPQESCSHTATSPKTPSPPSSSLLLPPIQRAGCTFDATADMTGLTDLSDMTGLGCTAGASSMQASLRPTP